RGIVRYGSHIVNPADAKSCSCKRPDGSLGSRSGDSRAYAAYSPHADMERTDSLCLGYVSCCNSRLHGCIWRRLVAVGCNVTPARAERDRFAPAQVGDVDKSIIVTAKDVGYPPFCLGNFV